VALLDRNQPIAFTRIAIRIAAEIARACDGAAATLCDRRPEMPAGVADG
jgi:hypothetical protein